VIFARLPITYRLAGIGLVALAAWGIWEWRWSNGFDAGVKDQKAKQSVIDAQQTRLALAESEKVRAQEAGYLLAGGAIVALAAWGIWEWQWSNGFDAGVKDQQAKQSVIDAQQTRLALAESEKVRAQEAGYLKAIEAQRIVYDVLQKKHAAALAGQRDALADAGELRGAIAAFAANSGDTATDTAAAASQRAATLGLLLAEALRVGAESAAGAESSGDAVRALLDSWPRE